MNNSILKIISALLLITLFFKTEGQKIFIKEDKQKDGLYFSKYNEGKITDRAKLSINKPNYILYWGADDNNIYGTDGHNVYSLDFTTTKTEIIYTSKEWINNFFVRNKHVYFTVTLTPDIDENEGRYTIKRHKIMVLDCIKKVILKQIKTPFNCNIIGLSVSPDEHKIVFINTLNIGNPQNTSYELLGFDIIQNKKEIYDKAAYFKTQWFIEGDTYNSISWQNNDSFYYLKKMGKSKNKSLLSYNLKLKTSKKVFLELPQRDIYWFVYEKNSVIYSKGKNLISFDGKIEKSLFRNTDTILQGSK